LLITNYSSLIGHCSLLKKVFFFHKFDDFFLDKDKKNKYPISSGLERFRAGSGGSVQSPRSWKEGPGGFARRILSNKGAYRLA
jgi:hypothetical protein